MSQAGAFPDRRDLLFGREPDIAYLMGRAKAKGLTAVVGRPKMGKTWLLEEVARRLASDEGYLVGYHECRGQTSDLFLRAISDLYTRWLSDASYLAQARSLWKRHKDHVITGVGKAVGKVFKAVAGMAGSPLEKLGDLVQEAFGGLAIADRDRETGGNLLCRKP